MRSMDKEYKLEQEAWIRNAEMTQAGNWIDLHLVALKTMVRTRNANNLYKMLCKSFTPI